jgi:hypothetical protein
VAEPERLPARRELPARRGFDQGPDTPYPQRRSSTPRRSRLGSIKLSHLIIVLTILVFGTPLLAGLIALFRSFYVH